MESYGKEDRLQKALKYLNVHVAMKVVHYMKRKTNIPPPSLRSSSSLSQGDKENGKRKSENGKLRTRHIKSLHLGAKQKYRI